MISIPCLVALDFIFIFIYLFIYYYFSLGELVQDFTQKQFKEEYYFTIIYLFIFPIL
jgi:hypothetical protein